MVMAKESFSDRFKSALVNQLADVANKTAIEDESVIEAREGKLKPLEVKIALNLGEAAFTEYPCKRTATVDRIEEKTVSSTKKKGVLGRAVVGGALVGGVGAIVGAVSAGSKTNAKTTQETVSSEETLDQGHLYFTNSRLLFVGNEIVSVDYKSLISIEFKMTLAGCRMELKYPGMLKNETFVIPGRDGLNAKDMFRAIRAIEEKNN